MRNLLTPIRDRATRRIREFLVGSDLPISSDRHCGDKGLLGPDSVSWMVLSDPSTLFGGLAALLQQACHPLVLQGVSAHSEFREDPLGRLRRTVSYVLASTYGATPEVEALAERINRVHRHVQGTDSTGARYSADDERLKLWVHCSLTHSLVLAWQAYGPRPLTLEEQDSFVSEQARVVRLLGVKAPETLRSLREELTTFESELGQSEATQEAVEFLVSPPVGTLLRLVYSVVLRGAVSLLAPNYRRLLSLSRGSSVLARVFCRAWRVVIPTNAILKAATARSLRTPRPAAT